MKLLPLCADQLLSQPTLPFAVYTQDGRMLLPAQARLDDPQLRIKLCRLATVYANASDHAAWLRRPEREWDLLGRRNTPLAQPGSARSRPPTGERAGFPGEEWDHVVLQLDQAMQDPGPHRPWLDRVQEIHARVRGRAARRLDEALFHLLYTGSCRWSFYSSRQALRCMLIAGEAARALHWDDARVALLEKAALTMNVSVWRLQDRLTQQAGAIDDPQERLRIARHPADGARLLLDSGVKEATWLEAVWLHHDASLATRPLAALAPGQQAAQLLHRVDCYSAMLSRRARSQPLSSLQAAQQACLGADGRPDPLGAVVLKAIGLYPPGTFVSLISNESGVVLERGEQANAPVVAALTNRDGMVMAEPHLRFTSHKDSAVRTALPYGKLPVDPPLDKLQNLRAYLKAP
jgi:hypothetical protein